MEKERYFFINDIFNRWHINKTEQERLSFREKRELTVEEKQNFNNQKSAIEAELK